MTLVIGWIESIIITILFIIASWLLHDPLSLNSPFPWIWFAPVLVALRYGTWPSLFSIVLLLAAYLYQDPNEIYSIHLQLFVLGGFLLTLICIAYQYVWSGKINYNAKISDYLQKRVETTAYDYKLAMLAYKHLEHNYIARPVTIRSSLGELRELLAKGTDTQESFKRFLNILAMSCSLETAAIFPVKKNQIDTRPIATIGNIKTPKPNDFLIQSCIEESTMTYVTVQEILKGHLSEFLIVAPFHNQENEIYALLVVEELPFLSLNTENLEKINLLMEYFSEGKTEKNADLILKTYPNCSVDFANELQRLFNLQKSTRRDSAVSAFTFLDDPHRNEYLFKLVHEKRGMDTTWETAKNNNKYLLILMPFTDRTGVESYRIHMEEMLKKEFRVTLNDNAIKFKTCQLSSFNNPLELLQDILNSK